MTPEHLMLAFATLCDTLLFTFCPPSYHSYDEVFVEADDNMDCSLCQPESFFEEKRDYYIISVTRNWFHDLSHIRLFCDENNRCESFYCSSVYAVILVTFRRGRHQA